MQPRPAIVDSGQGRKSFAALAVHVALPKPSGSTAATQIGTSFWTFAHWSTI